jgi:hypothetical protein
VGAQDTKGKLITAWSQRPDSPNTLAHLKCYGRTGAIDEKALVKLSKEYRQVALWEKSMSVWIDSTDRLTKTGNDTHNINRDGHTLPYG